MITDSGMDAIFHALAHGVRRFAVLEKAGLVISEKDRRVRRLYLNTAPVQVIHD